MADFPVLRTLFIHFTCADNSLFSARWPHCGLDFLPFPIRSGCDTGTFFEKAAEVGSIIEAEIVCDLCQRSGGVDEIALRFEQDAVLQDLECALAGERSADTVEAVFRQAHLFGILADAPALLEIVLYQDPETVEGASRVSDLVSGVLFQGDMPAEHHQQGTQQGVEHQRASDLGVAEFRMELVGELFDGSEMSG